MVGRQDLLDRKSDFHQARYVPEGSILRGTNGPIWTTIVPYRFYTGVPSLQVYNDLVFANPLDKINIL